MRRPGARSTGPAHRIAEGYVRVRSPAASWLVLPSVAEAIAGGEADAILGGPPARDKRPGTGRGGISRFTIGGIPVVGKRAMHGGLAGSALGDLYLGAGRAIAQIGAARRLQAASVPTPEVVAVGWRRTLLVLSALAIITRAIPGARNLYEAALEDGTWRRRRLLLRRVAVLIRAMHDAGFLHADLNVTNLLLSGAPSEERLHIVDLDKATLLHSAASLADRCSNLARLRRSYEKWVATRRRLSRREEILFLRFYSGSDHVLLRAIHRRLVRSARRRSSGGGAGPTRPAPASAGTETSPVQ